MAKKALVAGCRVVEYFTLFAASAPDVSSEGGATVALAKIKDSLHTSKFESRVYGWGVGLLDVALYE